MPFAWTTQPSWHPEEFSATGAGVVTSITAGPGISITGTAAVPIVNNTGVLSVTAGTNVTLGGTAANPIINAASGGGGTVTSVNAGTGISITGTAVAPIVNNTGVLSVTAGTAISVTGTAANPVVNNAGIQSLSVNSNGLISSSGGLTPTLSYGGPLQTFIWAITESIPILNDPIWLMPAAADSNGTFHVAQQFGYPTGINSNTQRLSVDVFHGTQTGGTALFTFTVTVNGADTALTRTCGIAASGNVSTGTLNIPGGGANDVGIKLQMSGATSATLLATVTLLANI